MVVAFIGVDPLASGSDGIANAMHSSQLVVHAEVFFQPIMIWLVNIDLNVGS